MNLHVPERWLGVCRDLDNIAGGLAGSLPPTLKDGTDQYRQKIWSYSLLVRTMSNFRGTLVMVSYGMRAEALTLSRSAIENAIFLNVLATDIGFVKELEQDDDNSREGLLKAGVELLRQVEANSSHEQELSAELDDLLAKGKKKRIEVKDLTRRIKRPELYALYRHLSSVAAHPSKTSIYMGFRFDPDGGITLNALREGGHELMVDTALFCACTALLSVCTEVNTLSHQLPLEGTFAKLAEQIANVKA